MPSIYVKNGEIQFWGSSKNPGWVGAAFEIACCPCECWIFPDNFNIDDTTTPPNWHENIGRGDWGIAGWTLVEDYSTLVDGTADAMIITTAEQPAATAGEQLVEVDIYNPQTGDIYYLYPCCPNVDTHGAIIAKFECVSGPSLWHVSIGSIVDQDFTVTTTNGFVKAIACVDHTINMAKARMNNSLDDWAWDDDVDPGTGGFSGIGHDNTGHVNVFDNYAVMELRKADGTICTDCYCRCEDFAPKKTLTLTLAGATGRYSCAIGDCILTYDRDPAKKWWYGSMIVAGSVGDGYNGIPVNMEFWLECESERPDEEGWYGGKNFKLRVDFSGDCCQLNAELCNSATALYTSNCAVDDFHLNFGPYRAAKFDLNCFLCYNGGFGPDSGEFYIVISE